MLSVCLCYHSSKSISRIIELLVMYEISFASLNRHCLTHASAHVIPDSKVHGANMGPTWVLSARDGPHVGPMNLAIRDGIAYLSTMFLIWWKVVTANQCGTIWKQKCYQTLQIMYSSIVICRTRCIKTLLWRHNERDGISNTGVSSVCSTVCSGTNQRKYQSSALLAFVRESTDDSWIPLTEGQ